jgi:hypothetical protein
MRVPLCMQALFAQANVYVFRNVWASSLSSVWLHLFEVQQPRLSDGVHRHKPPTRVNYFDFVRGIALRVVLIYDYPCRITRIPFCVQIRSIGKLFTAKLPDSFLYRRLLCLRLKQKLGANAVRQLPLRSRY